MATYFGIKVSHHDDDIFLWCTTDGFLQTGVEVVHLVLARIHCWSIDLTDRNTADHGSESRCDDSIVHWVVPQKCFLSQRTQYKCNSRSMDIFSAAAQYPIVLAASVVHS